MTSLPSDVDLSKMADHLRAGVAEQYNMSLQDYFLHLAAISPGPLNVYRRNESWGVGDGGDVKISRGVAWTLVAPLILLAVLVLVGVVVAALWRLKDRRRRAAGAPRGDQGRETTPPAQLEMQELQGGEATVRGLEGPAPGEGGGTPQAAWLRGQGSLPRAEARGSRFHHPGGGGGAAYTPHHHFHHAAGFSRDGGGHLQEDLLHLHGRLDSPKLEIVVASLPDAMKSSSSQTLHKASVDSLAHLLAAGKVPRELHCTMCQCYVAQRYQGNLFHPTSSLQHHPLHHHHDDPPQHHQSQLLASPGVPHLHGAPPCQQCRQSHGLGHPQLFRGRRDASPRSAPREKGRPRGISQSVDDHLHLVPHYQPPHPAAFRPLSELQDTVYQRLLQHPYHPSPDPGASVSGRKSCHGRENPLFSPDDDEDEEEKEEEPSSSVSRRDSPVGHGRSLEEEEKEEEEEEMGRGRHQDSVPRIINSTSMMSNFGDSDHTQSGGDRGAKRYSAHAGKSTLRGPDVSSIPRISSTSQVLHGTSSRLLPSTVISSSQTTITTDDEEEEEEGEEEEGKAEQAETLSLPSSISRFHASRAQFPPLMPDAQYPLTSTKAFFSPSFPGDEGQVVEGLENFTDNTSMLPNVGSSLTSGQASDLRESQTVSSSVSDPWAAPVDVGRPPSPSPSQPRDHEDPADTSGHGAGTEHTLREAGGRGEEVQDSVRGDKIPQYGVHEAATPVGARAEEGPRSGEATPDPESPGPRSRGVYRKSEPSSFHLPKSASELHRARILKGRKRKEPAKTQQHKQGFFLIPRQDAKSGTEAREGDLNNAHAVGPGQALRTAFSPGYAASPSRQQGAARPPLYGTPGAGETSEQPTSTWESCTPCRAEYSSTGQAQHACSGTKLSDRRKRRYGDEPHPLKLLSCSPSETLVDQSQPSRNQGTPTGLHVKRGSVRRATDGSEPNIPARVYNFNTTYPIPELSALKASLMSASFPNVSHDPGAGSTSRPAASTLEDRASRVCRADLKRTRSQEDQADLNEGGALFAQKGRSQSVPSSSSAESSLTTSDSLFASFQLTPDSARKTALPRAGQEFTQSRGAPARTQPALSGSKTESQILAEILGSFPQSSLSSTSTSSQTKSRQPQGTVYGDVTIPTAFADELFGFWSLSPELDANSQPRTPLMTPLKEEARRANREFIWGNSGSPSTTSASSSSFAAATAAAAAAGWPVQDDASFGERRRDVTRHARGEKDFGDYVQLVNTGSDRARSRSAQSSLSESTSAETLAAPAAVVEDARGSGDVGTASGRSTLSDYKSLPLNNLNVSHLYVISGYPDKDSVVNNNNNSNNNNSNSNSASADLVDAGHLPSNVVSSPPPPQASATASIARADGQNSHSPGAGIAFVLDKKKYRV